MMWNSRQVIKLDEEGSFFFLLTSTICNEGGEIMLNNMASNIYISKCFIIQGEIHRNYNNRGAL